MTATAVSDGRVDLQALIEAAKNATPGPWDVWRETTPSKQEAIDELVYQVTATPDEDFAGAVYLLNGNGKCPATTGCGPTSEANATFIALANPSTVAAMASELLALREAVKPFAEFISGGTNHRLPDDMPLTVGSQMARRQVTVRQFRALVKAAGASDSALSTQESPK